MSLVSSFPHNIHRGIKLFFLATIFSLVVGIIAVVVALREANNAFVTGIVSYKTLKAISTMSSVLSYCVMVLQIVGVNIAARDERYFQKARTALIIALVCTVICEFAKVGLISLVGSIASLCAELFIIKGIMSAALRLKNLRMHSEGKALYTTVLVVTFAPIGMVLLVAIAIALKSASLVGVLSICFLVAAVAVSIWQLVYMGKAVKMTNPLNVPQEEEEPWSPLDRPSAPFNDKSF